MLTDDGRKAISALYVQQIGLALCRAGLLTSSTASHAPGYSLAVKRPTLLDVERAMSMATPTERPSELRPIEIIEEQIIAAVESALQRIKIESIEK